MLAIEVLLGGSKFEETLSLSASEWVGVVGSDVGLWHVWHLDVPENVVWNHVEDLLLGGSSQTIFVGMFEVLGETVGLSILENGDVVHQGLAEFVNVVFVHL
jgi:hypothetical protein